MTEPSSKVKTPLDLGKYLCRIKTNRLIRKGSIKKTFCQVCNDEKVECHHPDYRNHKLVMWLCSRCHVMWHRKNDPIPPYFDIISAASGRFYYPEVEALFNNLARLGTMSEVVSSRVKPVLPLNKELKKRSSGFYYKEIEALFHKQQLSG